MIVDPSLRVSNKTISF